MHAPTADIRVLPVLDEDLIAEAWELYRAAFGHLEVLAAQRHLLTEEEFRAVALDPRVDKHLAVDPRDGSLRGIGTVTDDLASMPLVSEPYYAHRWPDLHARRAIHVVGFVGVHPEHRHTGAFPALVERMSRPAREEGGVVALDVCRYNETTFGLPAAIGRLVAEAGVRTVRLDEQVYWAYEFPGRD